MASQSRVKIPLPKSLVLIIRCHGEIILRGEHERNGPEITKRTHLFKFTEYVKELNHLYLIDLTCSEFTKYDIRGVSRRYDEELKRFLYDQNLRGGIKKNYIKKRYTKINTKKRYIKKTRKLKRRQKKDYRNKFLLLFQNRKLK